MDRLRDRRTVLRNLILLGCSWPLASCAHHARASRPPRVGFLINVGNEPRVAAFKEELRRLGHVEGKDVVIELREARANTSDLNTLAMELTHLDLDLIVASALPAALALRAAAVNGPMVIATCPGMVSNGFAQSLEHPGGNVTGMDELPPGVTAKRLTLLKTAAPGVSRVALLSTTPGRGGHETQLADAEQTAAQLGITVKAYRAASLDELKIALASIATDGMNGMLNFQGGLSLANRQLIVDFAAEQRLPAIYQATLFAETGGLMAWAPDLEDQFREAARYVDQILKGSRPGDLPVRYPPNYYLTVHAGTARALGLTLPPQLLMQAKRVLP